MGDVNADPLRTVYHATTPEGAAGILEGGFRQTGALPDAYFAADLQSAAGFSHVYGLQNILRGQVPLSALRPDDMTAGVRAPYSRLGGIPFTSVSPEEIAAARALPSTGGGWDARTRLLAPPAQAAPTPRYSAPSPADVNPTKPIDINIAGEGGVPLAPSGLSKAVGVAGRGLGAAADVAAIPIMINQAGDALNKLPRQAQGPAAVAAPAIIGGAGLLAAGATVGVAPVVAGAAALGAVATATGSATGQEAPKPGGVGVNAPTPTQGTVALGPDGKPLTGPDGKPIVVQAKPAPAAPGVPVTPGNLPGILGLPNAKEPAPGATTPGQLLLPGGRPLPTSEADKDKLPGGPNGPAPPKAPVAPPPSRQAAAGAGPAGGPPQPATQGAGGEAVQMPGQAAGAGPQGGTGAGGSTQPLPFGQQTPLDSFTSAMSAVGNVASDAFQVFDDIIKNIQAVAAIGDTLVRGPANTEDIVKIIQNLQTFLTTAADVAKTVGAVGSLIGGAGAGDPSGITSAVGSAISSIASLVSSAITAVNQSISLGIEIYHEVGKYVGFIFGGLLGGSLGTLGGNVHMLLNTRTGQIEAYSEDNPLNKNLISSPFTNAYNRPPPAQNQMTQLNMYSGPGTSPMQMFHDSMWIISTGAPQVASIAPGSE